jgi:hypothetical protein
MHDFQWQGLIWALVLPSMALGQAQLFQPDLPATARSHRPRRALGSV